ncbi:MAG: metal-dependent hydrolase [Candidatus Tectimicrobiota bacterium]
MANFKTHLSVAAALSGAITTGFLVVGVTPPRDVWLYFTMGTLGGILPDIDAHHSIPGRMLFSFFALVSAFLVLFSRAALYSIVELVVLWLGTYIGVRYIVFQMFARFTVHRGVFHSLLAAAFFGLLTTCLAAHLFHLPPFMAWMSGLFISIGYLVHLILDEVYSVDLTGARVKRSFGTALKVMSGNMRATSVLLLATIAVFCLTPSAEKFVQTVLSFQTYKSVKMKLLPHHGWFKLGGVSQASPR